MLAEKKQYTCKDTLTVDRNSLLTVFFDVDSPFEYGADDVFIDRDSSI